jgi:hypothetical protein
MALCCIPFFIFFLLSVPAQAAISVFTDETSWAHALSDVRFSVEAFDGVPVDMPGNSTLVLDFIEITLHGGNSDSGPTGITDEGFFQGEMDAGSDPLSLDFSFSPSSGFALIDLRNDSLSTPQNLSLDEIALVIGSQTWFLDDFGGDVNDLPFFGFVSDQSLDGFSLVHSATFDHVNRYSEEFYLGALTLAQPLAEAPEPPMWMLFALGAPLLLGRCRRRQSISEH